MLAEVLAEITISNNIQIKEIIIKLCELDEQYLDLINKLIDGLLKIKQALFSTCFAFIRYV
ncbi:hypothetical protein KK424_00480 [Clostridioides difficile]|nr:hypothetical protein [Clostridioides difficile]